MLRVRRLEDVGLGWNRQHQIYHLGKRQTERIRTVQAAERRGGRERRYSRQAFRSWFGDSLSRACRPCEASACAIRSGLKSFSFADTKSLVSCRLSGYRATYGKSVGTGSGLIVQCSGAKPPSDLSTGQGGHYRCAWSRVNELATWLEPSPLLHGDCEFGK